MVHPVPEEEEDEGDSSSPPAKKSIMLGNSRTMVLLGGALCFVFGIFIVEYALVYEQNQVKGLVNSARRELSHAEHNLVLHVLDTALGALYTEHGGTGDYSALIESCACEGRDHVVEHAREVKQQLKMISRSNIFPHRLGELYREYRHSFIAVADAFHEWTCSPDNILASRLLLHDHQNDVTELRKKLGRIESDYSKFFFHITLASVLVALVALVLFVLAFNRTAATVEKHIEKSLAAEKARDAVIHAMGFPALIIQDSIISDANRAAVDLFGYDAIVGMDVNTLLPTYKASFKMSEKGHSRRRCQIPGQRVDGQTIELVAHGTKTAASCNRYTVILNDVSNQLDLQKKVLAQFVHEMRNKYTAATHMLEIIEGLSSSSNTSSDADVRRELATLHEDVKLSLALLHEADQLVHTRLELHKVYNGRYESEPNVQTVDVGEVMQHRISAAAALGYRSVRFEAKVEPIEFEGYDVFVRVDMYMWTHICNNLLSNARKSTTNGSVTLAFLGHDDNGLHFAVRDTGKGITRSIASRLFKEEVSSGDVRGIGLGLVSCAKFSQAIGGDCYLYSTKLCTTAGPHTGGSEFRFYLPGRIVESSPQDPRADTAPLSPPSFVVASSTTTAPTLKESIPPLPPERCFDADNFPAPPVPAQEAVVEDLAIEDEEITPLKFRLVVVVEDSEMIRRTIIMKFKAAMREMGGENAPRLDFQEHETVESVLPLIDSLATRRDVIFTVDQNLDAKGGVLRGNDLIVALVKASYRGLIFSVSGDEEVAEEHKRLGAHASLGKPLPKKRDMVAIMEEACATKRGKGDDRYCVPLLPV